MPSTSKSSLEWSFGSLQPIKDAEHQNITIVCYLHQKMLLHLFLNGNECFFKHIFENLHVGLEFSTFGHILCLK